MLTKEFFVEKFITICVLGVYLVMIMCMISTSLLLAIIGINLSRRKPALRPVPNWAKIVFIDKLSKCLNLKLTNVRLISSLPAPPNYMISLILHCISEFPDSNQT